MFHPNSSKFPRFLSENYVPDCYNNRPSDRIADADNNRTTRNVLDRVRGRSATGADPIRNS